ncbi:NUDIX hydrolase [Nocardioides iriomotensis]|uniref:NUDIX domain-containing protein n=1 Tax=Nocardioides iriomotensis TaxID=715784 RepID=A0A4Q5J6E3_9ACTN|nr:NUDIX domain-containing protein [Nocardioides iriomotensis]RYU14104.1 NUDIX domain-containing protein [Nocardioides iriomotensis]
MAGPPVPCVGAVVTDGAGRFLLVLRGREPARGLWSIPGGKVEPGESDAEATAREVLEETGLVVEVLDLVGYVERPAPGGATYAINDYRCRLAPGTDPASARAGDDADDVGWFDEAALRSLPTSPGLVDALEEWGVLRRSTAG